MCVDRPPRFRIAFLPISQTTHMWGKLEKREGNTMTEAERKQVFDFLDQLKTKPGETIKGSLFKAGALTPSFVITDKIDGTFTLYKVEGKTLKKVQTAKTVKPLEDAALAQMK